MTIKSYICRLLKCAHFRIGGAGITQSVAVKAREWLDDAYKLIGRPAEMTVFDIGSNRGQLLDKMLTMWPNAIAYSFEPIPELASMLKQKYMTSKTITVEACALGSKLCISSYNVNQFDETSSILNTDPIIKDRKVQMIKQSINVQVNTVDDYCVAHGIKTIHIAKLDVQGYELEVLKGAANMMAQIFIIVTEVIFIPDYVGQCTLGELETFLRSHGFRLFNLYNMSSMSRTGQLGAADVMWVNERFFPYIPTYEPWELKWNNEHDKVAR